MTTKVRTIRQTVTMIKALDPETAITESSLRRLVKENRINATYIGTKALINEQEVIDYFRLNNEK